VAFCGVQVEIGGLLVPTDANRKNTFTSNFWYADVYIIMGSDPQNAGYVKKILNKKILGL
jgi:hypothetical protein